MPKVIRIDQSASTGKPQLVDLPLIPVQDRIIDMFYDGASIPEIACATRTSATRVLATIRVYGIIHHRQSVVGLLEAGPWVREQYQRIHVEVMAESQKRVA